MIYPKLIEAWFGRTKNLIEFAFTNNAMSVAESNSAEYVIGDLKVRIAVVLGLTLQARDHPS